MSKLSSKKSTSSTTRPFHLWNPALGLHGERIPSKFYSDPKRAHMGALKEMRWAHVGRSIEVLNVVKGTELGTYTRRVNSIDFQ
ncbi:MAG TPA: hypothetical protein VF077_10330 [Nitrospiraceae bacterium]